MGVREHALEVSDYAGPYITRPQSKDVLETQLYSTIIPFYTSKHMPFNTLPFKYAVTQLHGSATPNTERENITCRIHFYFGVIDSVIVSVCKSCDMELA